MKFKITAFVIFMLLFAGLVAALQVYDVAAIGPEGTSVGFSKINGLVHEFTGVNMLWYDITEWIGFGALGVAALFALTGLVQLIMRKSLLGVDREIYLLAGLYIVLAGAYVLFEYFIINYRPVIMEGESYPEASFPSSHTLLAFVILGSAIPLLRKYIRPRGVCVLLQILCVAVILVTVGGRLYSGVHWLTDIVGGVLLGMALLFLFGALLGKRKDDYQPMHLKT